MFFSVYNCDVIDKQSASMTSDNADDKAVIILVPVRLGGERTNTDYLEFVKVWNKRWLFFKAILANMKNIEGLQFFFSVKWPVMILQLYVIKFDIRDFKFQYYKTNVSWRAQCSITMKSLLIFVANQGDTNAAIIITCNIVTVSLFLFVILSMYLYS